MSHRIPLSLKGPFAKIVPTGAPNHIGRPLRVVTDGWSKLDRYNG